MLAQGLPPSFERIATEHGLSQGMINAIYQDRQGFLWFGTNDGLNRYDGYSFRVFRHDPFDSTSISGNFIMSIAQDTLGYLWVGTYLDGLNRLDLENETFLRFQNDPEKNSSLSADWVTAIEPAPPDPATGRISVWVGTENGLNRFDYPESATKDPDQKAFADRFGITSFYHSELDSTSIGHNHIKDIFFDKPGHMWVATPAGLSAAGVAGNDRLSFGNLRRTRNRAVLTEVDRIISVGSDSLWLATPAGLSLFRSAQGADGRFEDFPFPPYPGSVPLDSTDFESNGICRDMKGRVWISRVVGTVIFDPAKRRFRNLIDSFPARSNSLGDANHTVFADRSGVVWIGSLGFGLYKYDMKRERFKTISKDSRIPVELPNHYVSYFGEGQNNGLLVTMATRLFRFDVDRGILMPEQSIPYRPVSHISRTPDGRLKFLAAGKGLCTFDPATGSLSSLRTGLEEDGFERRSFTEDSSGNIWFAGTTRQAPGLHLFRWGLQSSDIREFAVPYDRDGNSKGFEINSGIWDRKGFLWYATTQGLLRIKVHSDGDVHVKIYRNDPDNPWSLGENSLKSVLPDPFQPDRYFWIGTDGGGLNRFDLNQERFFHYLQEDGLPNNVVYGILPDKSGNLWMSTNKGISKATLDSTVREVIAFRNYDARDGLQGDEFNTNAYIQNDAGQFFFGGVNGFTYFDPDSVRDNEYLPTVAITQLRIGYKSGATEVFHWGENNGELTLPHSANVLTFEFSSLDYSFPQKNLYSYRMEYLDPNLPS